MRHAIKVGIVLLFFLFVSSVVALRTFTIEETNFVKISSKAVDVDRNVITYNYSPTLNSKVEWQIDYDDAGEYLVNIGRIVPQKGLQYLIGAYQKIETNKKLVIVGTSSFSERYAKEMQRLASGNPNILFFCLTFPCP